MKAQVRLPSLSPPEPLSPEHDVSQFSCGKPIFDHWLKQRARSNPLGDFTAILGVRDAMRVVGYYGLGFTAVTAVAPKASSGEPSAPDAFPCLLLGPLATDRAWAGQGVGTALLRNALERCVAASGLVGGRALIVNAMDMDAAEFWFRRGFLPSRDDPFILFRAIADIAKSLAEGARGG